MLSWCWRLAEEHVTSFQTCGITSLGIHRTVQFYSNYSNVDGQFVLLLYYVYSYIILVNSKGVSTGIGEKCLIMQNIMPLFKKNFSRR